MDLFILQYGTTLLGLCFVVTHFLASKELDRSVKRSHRRYVAASVKTASCIGVSLCSAILATTFFYQGRIGFGSYFTFLALMWAMFAVIQWVDDDDNWFKKQFRRLKRGIGRLRSIRIRKPTFANPLPAPTPAPVRVR
jgi:UDP-N-acetylmuramyl pentapeptide phosphotransferase/UDP-N-acetylglucosamine-1-phosphate transferase